MFGATTSLLDKNTANGTQFHLTGCYAYGMKYIVDQPIVGNSDNKTSVDSCILYFNNIAAPAALATTSDFVIKNSLITGSGATTDKPLMAPYLIASEITCTASFCTFIRRGASTAPIIQAGKVINCIVSGTGDGVASDDHTYNLVIAENANFRNADDSGDGAAGTGDLEDQDPLFINGAIIGTDTDLKSYFQLQATSPAINYGTPYLLTTRDLTGNVRPTADGALGGAGNPDMGCFEYVAWAPYKDEGDSHFSGDFTINLYRNLPSNYRHRPETPPATSGIPYQVPFFLGPKGPISLRKEKAYLASVGNPSAMTGSG
jgi:hypothetical protein